ncbi:hypothetical protein IW261DRAFT_1608381 [Armillaria novae-zelandiae]|uniref:Cytochrome P450 n=1 Tax=Armillaria novae-zelandiae TaxID=153914 RepID=A0AA39P7E5_9AGAR|nr:hypothetical protein IW261DRAFT_1608381 [Armillaria novae-zelandiae]
MSFTEPQRLLPVLVFAATSTLTAERLDICDLVSIPVKSSFHQHFEQWMQEYGPVFSFRQGLKTIIVVGRFQAAVDIMEKEGASLADRPRSIAAGETLSGGMRVLLTSAGERFKKMRRALHSHLQSKSIACYSPILITTARQNMPDIVQDPERHQDHAKRHVRAAVVMDSADGKLSPSYKDLKI